MVVGGDDELFIITDYTTIKSYFLQTNYVWTKILYLHTKYLLVLLFHSYNLP